MNYHILNFRWTISSFEKFQIKIPLVSVRHELSQSLSTIWLQRPRLKAHRFVPLWKRRHMLGCNQEMLGESGISAALAELRAWDMFIVFFPCGIACTSSSCADVERSELSPGLVTAANVGRTRQQSHLGAQIDSRLVLWINIGLFDRTMHTSMIPKWWELPAKPFLRCVQFYCWWSRFRTTMNHHDLRPHWDDSWNLSITTILTTWWLLIHDDPLLSILNPHHAIWVWLSPYYHQQSF